MEAKRGKEKGSGRASQPLLVPFSQRFCNPRGRPRRNRPDPYFIPYFMAYFRVMVFRAVPPFTLV